MSARSKLSIILVITCLTMLIALGTVQAKKITLTVASGQDVTEVQIRREIAKMYEEINPDVEVKLVYLAGDRFQKQQAMITGGNAPDILYINQPFLAPWAAKGALMDLTPFIERDNFTFEGIHPVAVDIVQFEGKFWAMPFEVAPMSLVYNEDLFVEAGVPLPPTDWEDPEWTWDELIARAKKLTQDKNGDGIIDQYGYCGDLWTYRTMVRSAGGQLVSDDYTECTIDSPEARQGIQALYDLMYTHNVMPTPIISRDTPAFSQFMTGKLAMYHYGRWLNTFREIKSFKWDVAAMPHFPGRKPSVLMPVLHYGISTQCKHPEIAWDFLKFLITQRPQEVNTASGMAVPVLESVAQSPVLLESGIVKNEFVWWNGVQYGRPEETHPKVMEWQDALYRELENFWMNTASLDDAVTKAKQAVDAILLSND